jgi:hypothetical protein
MKQIYVLLSALVLITTISVQCHSSRQLTGTFKARLVATLCSQHIVQIEDPRFYKLGTSWKEYKNVFAVANHCDFAKAALKAGDTFTCTIVEKAEEDNCIVCEAYMETPELKRMIKVVQ